MALKAEQIKGRGVRLRDAWLAFASAEDRVRYQEPFKLMPTDDALAKGDWVGKASALVSILNGRVREAAHTQVRDDLRVAMRAALCSRLETGSLIGFGHQSLPTTVRQHRRIPADFWMGVRIDWDSEAAADASRTFHKILILDPATSPELITRYLPATPLSTQEIDRAIRELISADKNFKTRLVGKIKTHRIQEQIKKNNPDIDIEGGGYKESTIRKRLKAYNADKQ